MPRGLPGNRIQFVGKRQNANKKVTGVVRGALEGGRQGVRKMAATLSFLTSRLPFISKAEGIEVLNFKRHLFVKFREELVLNTWG